MSEYKSNSHRSKNENRDNKKVEKIVSGKARVKKKSGISKLKDNLISEDVDNVKSYAITDVLIPAAKKAISDIVTNGIDMILYGETKSKRVPTVYHMCHTTDSPDEIAGVAEILVRIDERSLTLMTILF